MFKIIMVVILSASLYDDFKKDKGLHTKAKIIHALFLLCMILLYSDMILYVGRLFRKFDETIEFWSQPIGFVPGNIHLAITLVKIIAGVGLVHFCLQMGRRKENAKKWVMKLLVIVTLAEIIAFYGGWIEGNEELLYHWLGILTGLIICGGICFLIIITYKKDFMVDFYERKDSQKEAIENFGKDV